MFTLNCNGRLLTITNPIVMGIINVTPDSFFEDSRTNSEKRLLQTADRMIADGATILDIGGQSTRPGAKQVSEVEELERVLPAIKTIRKHFPLALLSVDTFYSTVAKQSVGAGADIINDISGGSLDPEMIKVTGELNVPYICMHIRGNPQTMHQFTSYTDLKQEILDYFILKLEECRNAGIKDIIIDPGIGFAKNIDQNMQILRDFEFLKMLEKPILIGASRKGTVYKTLGITPDEALNGTTVLNTVALMNGAAILRVHDVKEACECVKLVSALKMQKS